MSKSESSLTGTAYVTNTYSNSVSVVDIASQSVTSTIAVGDTPYGTICTLDGKTVYVSNSGSNTVSVIDVASGTVINTIAVGSRPWDLALHPDGSKVYVTNVMSSTISIITISSNTVIATVNTGTYGGANEITFSPDGSRYYVSSYNYGVTALDTQDNSVIGSLSFGFNDAIGIAVNPLTEELLVTNMGNAPHPGSTLSVVDPQSLTVTKTITVGNQPSGVSVSGDGSSIYVVNFGSSNVTVIDAATYSVTATISVGSQPWYAYVSEDSSCVCVPNGASDSVSIIETTSNTVTETIGVSGGPFALTILPNAEVPGVTISSVTSPAVNTLFDVTYGEGKFVAVGSKGETMYSMDGVNWHLNTPLKYWSHLYVEGVVYSGTRFVGIGYGATTSLPSAFSSSNGTDWNEHLVNGLYDRVAWGNNLFVAVGGYNSVRGSGANIATSPDGSSWSVVSDVSGKYLSGVAYGNGQFVAVGSHARISTNGSSWREYSIVGGYLKDICWSEKNSIFLAVGSSGTIVSSPDGINWTAQASGTTNYLAGVCWDSVVEEFAAVGAGGIVLTSPDGVTWTNQNSPATGQLNGVGSSDGQFVAVGQGGIVVQMVVTK